MPGAAAVRVPSAAPGGLQERVRSGCPVRPACAGGAEPPGRSFAFPGSPPATAAPFSRRWGGDDELGPRLVASQSPSGPRPARPPPSDCPERRGACLPPALGARDPPLPQSALTLRGAVTGTPTHPYTKQPPPGGGAPRAGRPASPGVRGRAFPSPPDQPRVRPGAPAAPASPA